MQLKKGGWCNNSNKDFSSRFGGVGNPSSSANMILRAIVNLSEMLKMCISTGMTLSIHTIRPHYAYTSTAKPK